MAQILCLPLRQWDFPQLVYSLNFCEGKKQVTLCNKPGSMLPPLPEGSQSLAPSKQVHSSPLLDKVKSENHTQNYRHFLTVAWWGKETEPQT